MLAVSNKIVICIGQESKHFESKTVIPKEPSH